jgi:hypothetical protein
MIDGPFMAFSPEYILSYHDEGTNQRVRCSCGWVTESAAPPDIATRAARAHQRNQHPSGKHWASIRPINSSPNLVKET